MTGEGGGKMVSYEDKQTAPCKAQMVETGDSHQRNLKWGLNFYWGVFLKRKN